MKKHSTRYMIRAAMKAEHPILCDVESVEWIRAAEGESPEGAEAGPIKFKMRAYTGGPMQVGFYGAPVVIDLSGLTAKAPIPILMNHDSNRIVGHADDVSVGTTTLDLAGLVSGASAESDQVTASAKLGFPWKASVGARPDKMEFVGEGVNTTVNGKKLTGPLYVARKATLGEVSFVAMAADGKTQAKVAASAAISRKDTTMDPKFLTWLEASGFTPADLSEKQIGILQAAYDAEQTPATEPPPTPVEKMRAEAAKEAPEPPPTPVEKMRAEAAKEATRIEAIGVLCGDKHPTIKAKAIAEGWDRNATQIAVLKADLPKTPAIHASTRDTQPQTIEAALCMAGGLQGVEAQFTPDVLTSADAYRRSQGASLQGLILAAAAENGYTGARHIHRGNYDEVMRNVLGGMIRASAPSTHSLTTMLSTVGNKFLLEGFSFVEQVWREIASTRPVNDFKTITSYRMIDDMVFEEIGPAGEIKHGSATQESFTNQAKTYAKMFALTRQDIINDDLGAFNTIRERIGVGCGKKLNSIFWTAFLDDATFFNATAVTAGGHANLLTTVLGEAGISAANVLLKAQKDANGHPLGLGLQHLLLTGATLNPTAKKWYVSQEIRDTTASAKTPNANIYFNQYRPVESAYITSTTAWYLLPIGGGSMAPMEVCFLDGIQMPTIESADADFNTLGIQFRGYFDFGVARKEWRASVKSTGAG